jgi:hypothetical protein
LRAAGEALFICSTETFGSLISARFWTVADFVRTGLRPSQVSGLSLIFMVRFRP